MNIKQINHYQQATPNTFLKMVRWPKETVLRPFLRLLRLLPQHGIDVVHPCLRAHVIVREMIASLRHAAVHVKLLGVFLPHPLLSDDQQQTADALTTEHETGLALVQGISPLISIECGST